MSNMLKKIKKHLQKNSFTWLLIICILLFIGVGCYCWFFTIKAKDFGLNFTTGMMGVLITVFLIDRLIDARERKKRLPIRIVIFKELSGLYNRYVNIYFDLYYHTCLENIQTGFGNFYTSGGLARALEFTDIRKAALVTPPRTVPSHLSIQAKEVEDNAEKIIDKYGQFMEPEIVNHVHELLLQFSPLITLKALPNLLNAQHGLPIPSTLYFHIGLPEEQHLKAVVVFEEWLEMERKKLLTYDSKLYPINNGEYINNRNANVQLPYRINEDELAQQVEAYIIWRAQQQNQQQI